MSLEAMLIISAILFAIGLYGSLARRNALAVLMSIELMFNAVNLTLVALAKYVAPAGLQEAFRQSVRVAEIYAEELKPGRAGHEVKEIAENLAHQESIDALLYGHTQGNWVHGVGARTVFDWPERYGIFPRELVRVGEFWSIEFRVMASVPEWDGQAVPIPREEDAWIDADGTARFLTGPQTKLWIIRSGG